MQMKAGRTTNCVPAILPTTFMQIYTMKLVSKLVFGSSTRREVPRISVKGSNLLSGLLWSSVAMELYEEMAKDDDPSVLKEDATQGADEL